MVPIKQQLNALERLQAFKAPLTRLWEDFVCSYGVIDISEDDNCEFFFIDDSFSGDESLIDVEIEETVKYLASLLSRKEQLIKKEEEFGTLSWDEYFENKGLYRWKSTHKESGTVSFMPRMTIEQAEETRQLKGNENYIIERV